MRSRNIYLNIFCLSSKHCKKVPDGIEKAELAINGLREKRLLLEDTNQWDDLHEALKLVFPQLKTTGRYEVMHTERYSKTLKFLYQFQSQAIMPNI